MSIRAGLPVLSITLALQFITLGCDEAKPVEAEAEVTLQAEAATVVAADLDLAAVVALVEREDVRNAESLEALINAEDSTLRVDVDADGQRDFIAVHEVGVARAAATTEVELAAAADGAVSVTGDDGDKIQFELRAVPSSQATVALEVDATERIELEASATTVVVATVDLELDAKAEQVVITASYAPTVVVIADAEVEHHYVHTVALERRHDHLVVVSAPLIAWVWLDTRPLYIGHVHLPPGHAKRLGLAWQPPGHAKHHDTKVVIRDDGHHGHDGHGHDGHQDVHVKIQGKSNSHGGSTKIQVKSKGGGKGGGKSGGKGGKH